MTTPRTAPAETSASLADLIAAFNGGDRRAQELLIQRLYRDLRRVAAAKLRSERRNHTLQPTALVNEACVRLFEQSPHEIRSRVHLIAIASQLMRQILVDHARAHLASKRGGDRQQVTFDEAFFPEEARTLEVLVLDEALHRLGELDARHARIVEMHFFGGLTFEEIAQVLGVSDRTVKRDWSMARAWLRNELSGVK